MIPQAAAVTGTLYELFQIVFKMRKEAGLTKKVPNSSQVQKSPQVSNGERDFYMQSLFLRLNQKRRGIQVSGNWPTQSPRNYYYAALMPSFNS